MQFEFTSETWELVFPFVLMGLDVLTGVIYAFRDNCFSSAKMRSGLAKKAGEIIAIVLAWIVTLALKMPDYILTGIIVYISFMEIMSNIENLDKLGVPIPEAIKKKINNAIDETEDKLK